MFRGIVGILLVVLLYVSASADSSRIQNADNGHWYQRFDETMTWHDAKNYCESLGGYLATITSQQENDFIYNNLASPSPYISWLGATDEAQEGSWEWVTGEVWSYTNWYPGEPNNYCGEHYLHFTAGDNLWVAPTNGWNDLQTGNNGGIICSSAANSWFATSTICEWGAAPTLPCQGFEPPMDNAPVTVKKNRVLPLKATLLDGSVPVTHLDLVAPPVIQVLYNSGIGDAIDVTDSALPAGQETEGNQFAFDGTWWHFNLGTKNYTAVGTYTVSMVSGDATEYVVAPTCTTQFVIE